MAPLLTNSIGSALAFVLGGSYPFVSAILHRMRSQNTNAHRTPA